MFGKNEAPGSPGSSSKVSMTSPVTLEMQQGLLDSSSSGGGGSSKISMTSPVTAEMGPGEAGFKSMRQPFIRRQRRDRSLAGQMERGRSRMGRALHASRS